MKSWVQKKAISLALVCVITTTSNQCLAVDGIRVTENIRRYGLMVTTFAVTAASFKTLYGLGEQLRQWCDGTSENTEQPIPPSTADSTVSWTTRTSSSTSGSTPGSSSSTVTPSPASPTSISESSTTSSSSPASSSPTITPTPTPSNSSGSTFTYVSSTVSPVSALIPAPSGGPTCDDGSKNGSGKKRGKKTPENPGFTRTESPFDRYTKILKELSERSGAEPEDDPKDDDWREPPVTFGPQLPVGPRLENGDFYSGPGKEDSGPDTEQPEPEAPREQEPSQTALPGREEVPALTAASSMNLAAGMLMMENLSGVRSIMRLYRTGRLFEFATVSLDDMKAGELMVAADHGSSPGLPLEDRRSKEWHGFVQVYGVQGHRDSKPGVSGVSYQGYGLNAGIFSELNDHWIAGLMLGNQKVSGHFTDKAGSGVMESIRFGPFFSWSKDNGHLDLAFMVARNEFDVSRNDVRGRALRSRFSGMEWSAYAALGYDIAMDQWALGLTVMPVLELLYSRADQPGHSEKGVSDRALVVGKQSTSQWLGRAGLEVEYLLPDIEHPGSWHFTLGLQQQSLSTAGQSYRMPATGGAGVFKASDFHDSGLFFGIGYTRKQSERSSINIRYHGVFADQTRGHGLQLVYEIKF